MAAVDRGAAHEIQARGRIEIGVSDAVCLSGRPPECRAGRNDEDPESNSLRNEGQAPANH